MNLTTVIEEAVSHIEGNESKLKLVGEKLRKLENEDLSGFDSADLLEEQFFFPVKEISLTSTVGGVDSGFVGKKLHSVDLVLVRSVGALFEFKDGVVINANYFPGFYSFPFPHLTNHALDIDEFQCSTSLLRLREEINSAKQLIEKYSPGYCFLDGSIIPQYLDKPRTDSSVKSIYHGLLNQFQELYSLAEEKNCSLVGCIEDSRGSRLRTIIQEEILLEKKLINPEQIDGLFDSVLLDHLLEKGERSMVFLYSKNISEHAILQDFEEKWSKRIHAFYLKPTEFDRPLRVEFLSEKNLSAQVNELASVVLALSSGHREYAYPSILIEADLRARLKPEEIDVVFNKILDKLSKKIKIRLRRENRPFS